MSQGTRSTSAISSLSGRIEGPQEKGSRVTQGERIGVLGGTFDPPHNGHLALAEAVRAALSLTQLLFMPAAEPPHKRGQPKTPAAERADMVQRALSGRPGLHLARLDLERPGPHYSLDTIRLLRAAQPDAALWFVMGADSLRDLPDWRRPQELIMLCRLAVVPRPGVTVWPEMHAALLPGLAERVDMIECGPFAMASREIAALLRAGGDASELLPPAVLDFIAERGLYRAC